MDHKKKNWRIDKRNGHKSKSDLKPMFIKWNKEIHLTSTNNPTTVFYGWISNLFQSEYFDMVIVSYIKHWAIP